MKKIAGWLIAAAIIIAVFIFVFRTAGVTKDGGNATPTPTPTPTPTATATVTPPKTGTLTVAEVVALAKAGRLDQKETIKVRGVLVDTVVTSHDRYIVLGQNQNYVFVAASMRDFQDIWLDPVLPDNLQLVVRGDYYGMKKIGNYYGPVLEYVDRIE